MTPTTLERVRRAAQVVLVVAAIGFVAGAGVVFELSRAADDDEQAGGPSVDPTPEAGPVGVRPFLQLSGWDSGQALRVLFCLPGSAPDECVELGSGSPGEAIQSVAIPPTLTVDGLPIAVEPGVYDLRAGPPDEAEPEVHGRFRVVPFELGEAPSVQRLDGVDPRQITLGEPVEIARGAPCTTSFLPDNRILIGRSLFDPRTAVVVDLAIRGSELVWSRDRTRVAVVTGDRKEIQLASADGSGPETVVREARGLLSSVTWAPEGDRFAYVARPDAGVPGGPAQPTVLVFDATTGAQTEVIGGEAVAWSPAGDRLAVEVREAGTPTIRIVDPSGNGERLVDGRRPSWSPDGALIAYVAPGSQEAGAGFVTRSSEPSPVEWESEDVCRMAFSADGRRIAVVSQRNDTTRLVLRTIETPSAPRP